MSTLAEQLRAAFEEGYQIGFDHARSPTAAGKPIPGGYGAYDPPDFDRIWEESEAFATASASEPEQVDRFTQITRDMARSA